MCVCVDVRISEGGLNLSVGVLSEGSLEAITLNILYKSEEREEPESGRGSFSYIYPVQKSMSSA